MDARGRKWSYKGLLAAMAFGALVVSPGTVASAAQAETHCVVDISPTQLDAHADPIERGCFPTLREAHASIATSQRSTVAGGPASAMAGGIATHFTGTSYTGSSISITGTTCTGGTWTPTGTWDNNIESSTHNCGSATIRFFDAANCTGTNFPITGGATSLATMNNRTSCVKYG